MKSTVLVASCAFLAGFIGNSSAALIIGGSDLLSSTYANQLETWLGEGPIALTNIFDKALGDDASDFHSAADGKGRTVVVMEAAESFGTGLSAIIGGYDPQSWSSLGIYNETPSDTDRTGFLFNLSSTSLFRQRLTTDLINNANAGIYQTGNAVGLGPTFGLGHDIHVDDNLTTGYSYMYSYGVNMPIGNSVVDGNPFDI